MKLKLILVILFFMSVNNTFAQSNIAEYAIKDVQLVPANGVTAVNSQKPCAIVNKSSSRTITVKIEEETLVNNFLEKKIIAFEKICPKEQIFVGFCRM